MCDRSILSVHNAGFLCVHHLFFPARFGCFLTRLGRERDEEGRPRVVVGDRALLNQVYPTAIHVTVCDFCCLLLLATPS